MNYAPKYFPGDSIPLYTGANVTGGQCLVLTAANTVSPSSGESAAFVGVAVSTVSSGEAVALYTSGVHRLIAAGAITAGSLVKCAADGKVAAAGATTTAVVPTISGDAESNVAVTVTPADTAQGVVIGLALTAATDDGDVVLVKLI